MKSKTNAAKKLILAALAAALAFVLIFAPTAASAEEQFMGTGEETVSSETVSYTSKQIVNQYKMYTLPAYSSLSAGDCSAVIGASLLVYHDIANPNLLPFAAGRIYNGNAMYAAQNANINGLISTLSDEMNVTSEGVTVDAFKSGLSSYVSARGFSVSYSTLKSGSSVSASLCQTAFAANRPGAVFVTSYAFIEEDDFQTASGRDSLTVRSSAYSHAAAVYGYEQHRYYQGSSLVRTDTYLRVSFGTGQLGYLRIASTASVPVSSVYDMFSVNI